MTSTALAREEVFNNEDPLRSNLPLVEYPARDHLSTLDITVKEREKRLAACAVANIAAQHTQKMQLPSDSLFNFMEKLEAYVKEHPELDAKIEKNEDGESEGTITMGESELLFKNDGINLINPTPESIRQALEILNEMTNGRELILGIKGSDKFLRMVAKELASGKYPNIKVNEATQSKMEKLGFKNLASYERSHEIDDDLIARKKSNTRDDANDNNADDAFVNETNETNETSDDAEAGRTTAFR